MNTTVTVTGTDNSTQTIENARLLGIVGGQVCVRVETLGPKVGIIQKSTVNDYFIPVAEVASVVLADTGEGEDTLDAVGEHFSEDWDLMPA